MSVQMELSRIIISEVNDQQVVYLKEVEGDRTFPILIGLFEATSIDRRVKHHQSPRPLTHDLMGRVFHALGHRLQRIVINELRDSTFHAQLVLAPADAGTAAATADEKSVDCRPSDAIAMAVQTGAPMYVARAVFEALAVE